MEKEKRKKSFPVFRPCYGKEEIDSVTNVLKSGWVGLGPKTAEFEKEFANKIGVGIKNCISVNSCTAALEIAVRLSDVKAGEKVLVPTMTFCSTAHAVTYNQAEPVFIDCDYLLQMDYHGIMKSIEENKKKIKAIIVVHFGGRIHPNILQISEYCSKNDIYLIEDCAHAMGATLNGKHAGTFGDFACFSFHAVKNLAMGDGGMLVSIEHTQKIEEAKKLRWLGIDKGTWDRSDQKRYSWEYNIASIGYKCHTCDILSAIGLEQLKKIDYLNERRLKIVTEYFKHLTSQKEISTPLADDEESKSSWHLFIIMLQNEETRNALSDFLAENNISTSVHYKPIHLFKCYGEDTPTLPTSEQYYKKILTLPVYPEMKIMDVKFICKKIKEFFDNATP